MRKHLGLVAAGVMFLLSSNVAKAADVAAGQEKAQLCAGCHGPDGISFSPEIPNLAGQKAMYLEKAVKDYRSGARKNPMMSSMVGSLSDQDIADISAFFSSLHGK